MSYNIGDSLYTVSLTQTYTGPGDGNTVAQKYGPNIYLGSITEVDRGNWGYQGDITWYKTSKGEYVPDTSDFKAVIQQANQDTQKKSQPGKSSSTSSSASTGSADTKLPAKGNIVMVIVVIAGIGIAGTLLMRMIRRKKAKG